MKIYAIAIVLVFFLQKYDAKYIEGVLTDESNWKFLTRFCFMSKVGTLQYEFEYSQKYLTQNLLLYFDSSSMWDTVYRSTSMSCTDRQSKLSVSRGQIHSFNVSSSLRSARFSCQFYDNTSNIFCKSNGQIQFSSSVPYWWFLVISNCQSNIGLEITYRVWMRNGDIGDTFNEHFSADETNILETDMFFMFAQLIIFACGLRIGVRLKGKQFLHSTYKIFILSLVLQLWHIFFKCVAYGVYANTGRMNTAVRVIGDSLAALSQIIFILMLLLLSLGYTVICGKLPSVLSTLLTVFIFIYTMTYVVLFVLEITSFDPALVLYRNESQAGLLLQGLQILAWIIFLSGCIYTSCKHRKKKLFYLPLLGFYSIWFWATPILVFVGIGNIPLHMKEKVVNATQLSIAFCGQLFYLILTRPSSANINFPFNLKTSQISSITLQDAEEDNVMNNHNGSSDNFTNLDELFSTESTSTAQSVITNHGPITSTNRSMTNRVVEDASVIDSNPSFKQNALIDADFASNDRAASQPQSDAAIAPILPVDFNRLSIDRGRPKSSVLPPIQPSNDLSQIN